MKKVFYGIVTLMVFSCGNSAEDLEQKTLDMSIANVCNCFEANKEDWLAYQKCKSRVQTGHILLEDKPALLEAFDKAVADCNKYFKD